MYLSELIQELQHQLRTHGDMPVLLKHGTTFMAAAVTIAEKAQPAADGNPGEWELTTPSNPNYQYASNVICIF